MVKWIRFRGKPPSMYEVLYRFGLWETMIVVSGGNVRVEGVY